MAWLLISLMLLVYTLVSVFLIFVILLQEGKGGGLSSLGSASPGISESFGATGAEKTLKKVTTWCAVMFMVLAIALTYVGSHSGLTKNGGQIFNKPAGEAQAPLGAQPSAAKPATPAKAPAAPAPAKPAAQ